MITEAMVTAVAIPTVRPITARLAGVKSSRQVARVGERSMVPAKLSRRKKLWVSSAASEPP